MFGYAQIVFEDEDSLLVRLVVISDSFEAMQQVFILLWIHQIRVFFISERKKMMIH